MSANLQKERMRRALRIVDDWPNHLRQEAAQRAKGLPVELRTQGLVVTVTTLMNGSHGHLANDLARWVLDEAPHKPLSAWTGGENRSPARRLLQACLEADRAAFLAAQAEALALAEHIKRFAAPFAKGA